MLKTVEVRVTREDIENGEQRDSERCPVAYAMGRIGFKCVDVNYLTADFCKGPAHEMCTAKLPVDVRRFIRCFDRGLPVEPFTFVMEYNETGIYT